MTDFNFDPNTMTRAYAQRKALTEEENVRPKARPKGIASKPDDGNTDTSSDEPNFYDKMLDKLLGYFSSEDDANKVLSDKTPDRQDTQTSYEDMFGGLSQETRDAVEQAKQKRMGPADRRDVDVVEKTITEEAEPKPLLDPKDIAPDLQIMKPEGIEDMPPLPKPATDDGGLMSRDTPTEKGETTTDTGLMSKSKVKEDTGYTVKSGDTFDEIAKDNNITPADLRAANPDISDYNKIIVGQEINLGSSKIGEGLTDDDMGLPDDRSTTEKDMALLKLYTDDYASVYLKEHEGLVAHKSLEGGKDTASLGVKFPLGLKRKDYNSDESFAAAVALKHKDKAKAKFTDADWATLPQSVKFALTDLNFNVGTIGSTADKTTIVDQMKNTLAFIGMTTKAGDKASLIALAKRRAWNWNKSSADINQEKIVKIKQIPTTTGGTTFEYLDANGDVIYSTTSTRTPVKLDKKGVATTLTKTREVTL